MAGVSDAGAEETDFGGAEVQFFQSGDGVGVVRSGLEVEVEAILPGMAGNGAALDFEEIDFAAGENSKRAVKRSGLMRELDDKRKFIGACVDAFGSRRLRREEQETRVIFAMVLDVFEEDFAAVDFGGAFGGDGRARGVVSGNDGADAASSVERGDALKLRMYAEEMFALRERDGMRLDGGEAVERGVRRSDQVKRDGMNDFADDVKTALEKQIVGSVNGARESILDGREGVVGGAFGDGGEKRFEGRARDDFDVLAEEADCGLFAESSALALESDAGDGSRRGH